MMYRLLLLIALVAMNLNAMAAKNKTVIDRIEPANWFASMKNPQLQLMVYGKDIASVETVTTDYPGVVVDSVVRLDSPNYLFVYLNLKDAQPGTMMLTLKGGKVKNSKGE